MRIHKCTLVIACALLSACDGGGDLPPINSTDVSAATVRRHIDALPQMGPTLNTDEVELGRLLFWDPILSADKQVACASCHHPDLDYADGQFASLGVGATGLGLDRVGGMRTPRNSQTVLNSAFAGITLDGSFDPEHAPMFWDSRVTSLEAQAREPVLSEIEMRGETFSKVEIIPTVIARVANTPAYAEHFERAFGDAVVTEERVFGAIANFQRSLIANNSPFDRFMRGEREAMSDLQIVGMQRFVDIGCAKCHSGPMLSDYQLHVLGAEDNSNNPNGVDRGAEDRFAFRTPPLRNLIRTAPYLHGGSRDSLADVLNFYDQVAEGDSHNSQVPRSALDPDAVAMNDVDDATAELVAFLQSLDDPEFDRRIPTTLPSGLAVGGAIQ